MNHGRKKRNMLSNVWNHSIVKVKSTFFNFVSALKTKPFAEIYLYIVLLLFPTLPAFFVIFDSRVTTFIALGCLALIFTAPQLYRIRISLPKIIIILVIFFSYVFCAIANNELFTSGFLSFVSTYLVVPIYFAVLVDTKEKFDRCATILIISGLILCFFSLFELFFQFNIFSLIETVDMGAVGSGSSAREGLYRIESSFGQAIAFGIYLSFMVCLSFYKLFRKENQSNLKQNIYLTILFIFNLFVFLTYSRFPLVVVLLADIIMFFKLNKKSKIKALIGVAVIATFIVLVTLVKGSSMFVTVFDNIISIFKGTSNRSQENTAGYRLSLFKFAKQVIGNDFVFGRGLHVNTFFIHKSPNYGLLHGESFDNGYVYLFLQQGILGVIVWIVFCYYVIASCVLSYKKGFNDDINFPVLMIVIICLANMFSVARLDESRAFMVIIGCYLGMDINLYKIEQDEPNSANKKPSKIKEFLARFKFKNNKNNATQNGEQA